MSKNGGHVSRLREKEKQRILKLRHGNEMPVMSYCMKARSIMASRLDREEIIDKPAPKPVPSMVDVVTGKVKLREVRDCEKVRNPQGYALKLNRSERRALKVT